MLLSRREWVYLLILLIPFIVYNLALKASSVVSHGDPGVGVTLDLMRSGILFNLGYALFWVGLFAAVRGGKGPLRGVVVLFHVTTILALIITTSAYQYFRETGITLDYGVVVRWITEPEEVARILAGMVPLSAWMLLFAILSYAALGPLLLTHAAERWWTWPRNRGAAPEAPWFSFLVSGGLLLLALGLGGLSAQAGTTALARDPFVDVVLKGVGAALTAEEKDDNAPGAGSSSGSITERLSGATSLAETPRAEKRNVVLIHLESTRARSVTPYNKDVDSTPFLNELAKSSLLAERARVVVPRSAKGHVAINCGIEPTVYPSTEYEPGGIPAPCLAELLKEQGYDTVFFQSLSDTATSHLDGILARSSGYEEFYPSETMDTTGFQVTNTFGYEEDIMLEPSREWLENRDKSRPFLAEYFTGTGHYGYECSSLRTGFEDYGEPDELNRYLNCLRYLDSFVELLVNQYEELGIYEETIFVIFGDHGEGFGEHGRLLHGDTIYEEGLHVPLLIHAPGWFEGDERVEGLSSQIDVLPTVLEMLGYELENGEYPGYSLLHPLPEDRTIMSSCISPYKCMASLRGYEKYIHHYDDQPDEFFDLYEDPLEEYNLAGERPKEEIDKRREELLSWRASVNAVHGVNIDRSK